MTSGITDRARARAEQNRGSIRWLMGRVHVSTPDDEIRDDIRGRAQRWNSTADDPHTADDIAALEAVAVAEHHRNRDQYRWVTGSLVAPRCGCGACAVWRDDGDD